MSGDAVTVDIVPVQGQADVTLVVQDEVRYCGGYQHVSPDVEFSRVY